MKEVFKPSTDERPIMIIIGILALYILIDGFILYLFFLHRISFLTMLISAFIFTIIYLPRLLIIKKLAKKDIIKITDDGININNKLLYFSQIEDFKVEEKKPVVVFFMNNSMVVFQEAKFYLKTSTNSPNAVTFCAIGTEKIQLLKEFLSRLLKNN